MKRVLLHSESFKLRIYEGHTQNGPSSPHKRARSQKRERESEQERKESDGEKILAPRAIKRCREAQKWLRLSCSQADKSPSIKEMRTAVGCYGRNTPLFYSPILYPIFVAMTTGEVAKDRTLAHWWIVAAPNPQVNVPHVFHLHLVKRMNWSWLFKKLITCLYAVKVRVSRSLEHHCATCLAFLFCISSQLSIRPLTEMANGCWFSGMVRPVSRSVTVLLLLRVLHCVLIPLNGSTYNSSCCTAWLKKLQRISSRLMLSLI